MSGGVEGWEGTPLCTRGLRQGVCGGTSATGDLWGFQKKGEMWKS